MDADASAIVHIHVHDWIAGCSVYAPSPMTEDDVATLYREYGYLVFRRCVAYLGNPDTAYDVLQDVFVRVLRTPGDARPEIDPRTWLCRITDQLCLARIRPHKRHVPAPTVEDEDTFESAIEAAIGDDDREPLMTVRRLIKDLDRFSVRLAVLYYLDELTEEELARELGLSRRALDKHLNRLMAHARSVLRGAENPEEKAS